MLGRRRWLGSVHRTLLLGAIDLPPAIELPSGVSIKSSPGCLKVFRKHDRKTKTGGRVASSFRRRFDRCSLLSFRPAEGAPNLAATRPTCSPHRTHQQTCRQQTRWGRVKYIYQGIGQMTSASVAQLVERAAVTASSDALEPQGRRFKPGRKRSLASLAQWQSAPFVRERLRVRSSHGASFLFRAPLSHRP